MLTPAPQVTHAHGVLHMHSDSGIPSFITINPPNTHFILSPFSLYVHLYKLDNFRLNNIEEDLSLEETNFSQQPLITFSPSFKGEV